MKNCYLAIILCFLFAGFSRPSHAQQIVGECLQGDGKIFGVYQNFFVQQKFFPANQGQGYRDPSGQAFMRFPSVSSIAVWVTWDMNMIQIDQMGWHVIGKCQMNPQFVQSMAIVTFPMPQQYNAVVFESPGTNGMTRSATIPANFLIQEITFVKPLVPQLSAAQECQSYVSQGNHNGFMDCMAPKMMGSREHGYYDCMRRHGGNQDELALCMLGRSMGQNERAALNAAEACYRQYGTAWQQYPACALQNNLPFDERTARAIQCLEKSAGGNGIDYLGMGVCYAGPDLMKGMNQESLIAMQCAMASGGDPMTFATCTGGQLATNELNKCFTHGIGGNGCFGDGNTLVSTARNIGNEIGQHFGQNSAAVQAWNAMTTMPGPNNEAVKIVNHSVREMEKAGKNIGREVKKILPRIRF
ncbi:hypothetical protein ABIB38_000157 [Massilia sp. UYP11]|uniref:hypothetical protein n=1 Tax=Massilia sp. UYP11 TaxID=1756385 RepID=UPI003D1C01DD